MYNRTPHSHRDALTLRQDPVDLDALFHLLKGILNADNERVD